MLPMRRPQSGPIGSALSSGIDVPASGLDAPQFVPIQTPPMQQQKQGGSIAQGIVGLGKALMAGHEDGGGDVGSGYSAPTQGLTMGHEAGNTLAPQGGGLSDLMSKFKGLGDLFK